MFRAPDEMLKCAIKLQSCNNGIR